MLRLGLQARLGLHKGNCDIAGSDPAFDPFGLKLMAVASGLKVPQKLRL
jgi:hypothetical protein